MVHTGASSRLRLHEGRARAVKLLSVSNTAPSALWGCRSTCAGASGGAVTAEGLSPRDNPQVEHLCPLFVSQWWLMLPTCRMFIRPLQSA